MALLAEVSLPLQQLTPELLVSSRTHLPGYQGLVEEALLLMQLLVEAEGLR